MNRKKKILLTWIFGAVILTATMIACAGFYNAEQVKIVFVIFVCVCSPLVFLHKHFGFLFLPVLVGSFFFMGYYDTYYWEKKSLEHYSGYRVEDLGNPGAVPPLARFQFSKDARPDFSRMVNLLQYDNMKRDGTGHGMLLSEYFFLPLVSQKNPGAETVFICRFEVKDGTPGFDAQKKAMLEGEDFQATTLATTWLDSLALTKLEEKYHIGVENPVIVRWGNPEDFYAAAWKKLWQTFLFSHLAWLILLILHFYQMPVERTGDN